MLNDDGVRMLASAVLLMAFKDVRFGFSTPKNNTENQILNGSLNFWFDLLKMNITGEKFIKTAKQSNQKIKFLTDLKRGQRWSV